jgi:DNA-binding transcriptional ArsR family regulator
MYYHGRMAVRNVMSAPLPVELRRDPAFELLISLYALEERELWLHLLGLALELPAGSAAEWVDLVAGVEAEELRRHVLGLYVPAWREVAGAETIERAAGGDAAAADALLADERYYAGNAVASLADLLPLDAATTRDRILARLAEHLAAFAPGEAALAAELAADVEAKRRWSGYELIDRAAGGYRYETEPGFERVVLVPQIAARPWLLLCQHRTTRLICYPAAVGGGDDRLVVIGRALGDEKRLAILKRLRESDATLGELAAELGLAKSTTHHHLGQLRSAGLIALAGNAQGYRYTLAPSGFAEAETLLGGFAGRSL